MTGNLWTRLVRGVRRLRGRPEWEAVAPSDWRESVMHLPAGERFHAKQGRDIGLYRLERDGKALAVYLKRHHRLPLWDGLLAWLRPGKGRSPGLQEWQNLCWAEANGFPVPTPVAAGEMVGPWGRLQSFLAVAELTDQLPLHEAIPLAARTLSAAAFAKWKRGLTHEVARLARMLHATSHYHKDLYLCHFYVAVADIETPPATWRKRVVMIDLHRLGYHPVLGLWYRLKDLAQMLYSSEVEGVTARDRLRFAHAYGCGSWVRWLVALRWRRYRRHNAKRKVNRTP